MMNLKITVEKRLEQFRKVHGDKYDYSLFTEYAKARQKIKIICPSHGVFTQTVGNHAYGFGCARCARNCKLSVNEIIEQFHQVHGDKYDYSLFLKYKGAHEKIKIICPLHGPFEQTIGSHKSGCGCPKCGRLKASAARRSTTEEVLLAFKEVHGDKYDYCNFANYKSGRQKIKIVCGDHGLFEQAVDSHRYGRGCPKCGAEKSSQAQRSTLEQRIHQFKEVHGDRYGYSLFTEYKQAHQKIKIICPLHGEFVATIHSHRRGLGCKKCGTASMKLKQTFSIEQRVQQFNEVHDSKYDYSSFRKAKKLKSNKYKINILCPEHGTFRQTINSHLRGRGCPTCADIVRAEKTRVGVDQRIEQFRDIHGNKYDYSLFNEDTNSREKIKIICPDHGIFEQTVASHCRGSGCPNCAGSRGESLLREVLEEKFGKLFPNTRHPEIINPQTGKILELDCYNDELKLAFEYNGRQHYEPVVYFGGEEAYEKTIYRDTIKREHCKRLGIRLVEIDGRLINRLRNPVQVKEAIGKYIQENGFELLYNTLN